MANSTHNSDYQLLLTVLKSERERLGITQTDLANRLGNTQTFVSKCERGERRIDAVELVEFAEALGIEPSHLFGQFLLKRGQYSSSKTKKAGTRSST
jgi:transcriptional regulator with XRE-family HTH domain